MLSFIQTINPEAQCSRVAPTGDVTHLARAVLSLSAFFFFKDKNNAHMQTRANTSRHMTHYSGNPLFFRPNWANILVIINYCDCFGIMSHKRELCHWDSQYSIKKIHVEWSKQIPNLKIAKAKRYEQKRSTRLGSGCVKSQLWEHMQGLITVSIYMAD